MRAIVGETEETGYLVRFGSRRLCSGKRILLDSEFDGGLSSSHVTHIRIAKDQDRKAAKGPIHYRYNERRRSAKRDPLICEDLPGCAEGFWQPFGKGSDSARPNSDRPRPRDRPRPGNSGESMRVLRVCDEGPLAIALAPVTPVRGRQYSRHPESKRIRFQNRNRTDARIRRRTLKQPFLNFRP